MSLDVKAACLANGQRHEAFHIILTPELAEQFLATMDGNRPCRRPRVQFYAKAMAAGEWVFNGEPIIFDVRGAMVNGQHRCEAVIESDTTIEIMVVPGVPVEAYKTMDRPLMRTGADYLPAVGNRTTVAATFALLHAEAVGQPGVYGTTQPGQIPELLARWPRTVEDVAHCRRDQVIGSVSQISYCYARMRMHDEPKAAEFMASLREGVGLESGSPVLLLRNRLLGMRSSKAKLPPVELLAVWSKAWRKHLAGQKVQQLQWRNSGQHAEEFPAWPGRPL